MKAANRGSPVIAAIKSLLRIRSGKKIKLGVFAIEEDPANYLALTKSLESFKRDGVPIETRRGAWVDFAGDIARKVNGAPVLVFVDPFGLKGIEFGKMEPILRSRAADVLFRIHDQAIHRNAPDNPDLVTQVLGTAKWNEGWDVEPDPNRRIEIAHAAFADRIRKSMKTAAGVVTYPVKTEFDKPPEYSLVFASKHRDGVDLFNERAAKNEIELSEREEAKGSRLPGMLIDHRRQQVERFVSDCVRMKGAERGDEVLSQVRARMAVTSAEIGKALKSLRSENRLSTPKGQLGWKRVLWTLKE